MYFLPVQSDQLYTSSDEDAEQVHRRVAQKAGSSAAPTAPTEGNPARLAYRALQALRQTRMQMRRRSRSWTQILFVGELPERTPANGLRAAGAARSGDGVAGQLPPGSRDSRADLGDQSRTAAPPRGALLTARHERDTLRRLRRSRYGTRRCTSRQYARRLAGWRLGRCANRGVRQ